MYLYGIACSIFILVQGSQSTARKSIALIHFERILKWESSVLICYSLQYTYTAVWLEQGTHCTTCRRIAFFIRAWHFRSGGKIEIDTSTCIFITLPIVDRNTRLLQQVHNFSKYYLWTKNICSVSLFKHASFVKGCRYILCVQKTFVS